MPSRKFLLVEGVQGLGVCHPHAPAQHGGPAVYVGHELDDCEHIEAADEEGRVRTTCAAHPDPDHVMEHYRPARQVVLDAPELRAAIKHKELKLHGECVAKNFDDARKQLEPKAAAPPPAALAPTPHPAPTPSGA